ncbi:MAG TPA: flagellar biosynthesis protein FlhB [Planctomycetes bacterium]|nr:flagellar biosynthesis protein FlhB [Planctomycetota bacterium]
MAEHDDKDQKTEEATPRRQEEAREKGQVAMSTEFIAAVSLAVGLGTMLLAGGTMARVVGTTMVNTIDTMASLGKAELTVPMSAEILTETFRSVLGQLAIVTLPAIALSLLVGYLQVGFQVTPKAMELEWNKVNPISGWSRLFSMKSVVRTGMSGLKITAISTVVILIALRHIESLARVGINDLGPVLAAIGKVLFRCSLGAVIVVILLGVVDLIYQRFQHSKDLRMTKQEIKEEGKMTEGDPHVKARIRRMQNELASRRMMQDVPKATVVVTNPTHYAVALRYEQGEVAESGRGAPVVLAKGTDLVAQRIKAIAKEHGIVCYEDVPLARALHAQCEVGQEIPQDLYGAVAAVLGYVYRLRGMVTAGA